MGNFTVRASLSLLTPDCNDIDVTGVEAVGAGISAFDQKGTVAPVPTVKLRMTFLLSLLMVFHNGVNNETED